MHKLYKSFIKVYFVYWFLELSTCFEISQRLGLSFRIVLISEHLSAIRLCDKPIQFESRLCRPSWTKRGALNVYICICWANAVRAGIVIRYKFPNILTVKSLFKTNKTLTSNIPKEFLQSTGYIVFIKRFISLRRFQAIRLSWRCRRKQCDNNKHYHNNFWERP